MGKVVSITGAGSGIGLATAFLLYSRGATLTAADINEKGLEELEQTLRPSQSQPRQSFTTTPVDVTREVEVNAWIDAAVERFGRLDHSTYVAGAAHQLGPMAEQSIARFDFTIDVNLRGVYNCMRAQLPHLKPGSGIVNVRAGARLQGIPNMTLYSAAKAGVNTLTATVAREYGPKGIRVNAVAPGLVLTLPSRLASQRLYTAHHISHTSR